MGHDVDSGIGPAFADVAEFHTVTNTPIKTVPEFPDAERIKLRWRLINEELNKELIEGLIDRDIVTVADAIADTIYVLIGMALEFGIPLDLIWAEVQRTNMAKVDPATGKVTRREDGKILKPDGWTPPDLAAIIEKARKG